MTAPATSGHGNPCGRAGGRCGSVGRAGDAVAEALAGTAGGDVTGPADAGAAPPGSVAEPGAELVAAGCPEGGLAAGALPLAGAEGLGDDVDTADGAASVGLLAGAGGAAGVVLRVGRAEPLAELVAGVAEDGADALPAVNPGTS